MHRHTLIHMPTHICLYNAETHIHVQYTQEIKIEKAILWEKVTIDGRIKMNKLIQLGMSPSKGFINTLDIYI